MMKNGVKANCAKTLNVKFKPENGAIGSVISLALKTEMSGNHKAKTFPALKDTCTLTHFEKRRQF